MTPAQPPEERIESTAAHALALATGVLSAAVLCGWILGLHALKRIAPGMGTMDPMTAILLLALTPALWILASPAGRRPRRPMVDLAAGLVGLIALSRLFDVLTGTAISPDQLLFGAQLGGRAAAPSSMAPGTALCFVFAAAAILATDRIGCGRRLTATEVLLAPVSSISLLAIVGYAYQNIGTTGAPVFIAMTLHTAAAFQMLALGLLLARPDQGVTAVVCQRTPLGRHIRAVLPTAVVGPLVLGGIVLWADHVRLIAPGMGISVLVLLLVCVLGVMILRGAVSLHEVELQRRRVDEIYLERRRADEAAAEVTEALMQMAERLRPIFGDEAAAGRTILSEVLGFCRMPQGCLYWLPRAGDQELSVLACAAYGSERQLQSRWRIGEGLPGQCAREKSVLVVKDVPADYFRIRSGTLDALPRVLVLTPVLADGELVGVLEVAGFSEPDSRAMGFLQAVSRPIAFALFRLREESRRTQGACARPALPMPAPAV